MTVSTVMNEKKKSMNEIEYLNCEDINFHSYHFYIQSFIKYECLSKE